MFSTNPNYTKLKTHLRLAINRLKLLEKKKTELALKARKEIAEYIASGKVERAKIRVEHIIREDYMVEAMEVVEMYCDLIIARFGLVTQMKELDEGLSEAISSLLWVAPRMHTDVQELKIISDLLTAKYGKIFADACRSEQVNSISEKLKHKMSVHSPPKILVEKYLIEIAKNYNVEYQPDEQVMREEEGRDALLIDVNGPAQPPGFIGYPPPPSMPMPPLPPSGGQGGQGQPPFQYPGGQQPFQYPTPSGGRVGGFIDNTPSFGSYSGGPTTGYKVPPGVESKDLSNSFLQERSKMDSPTNSPNTPVQKFLYEMGHLEEMHNLPPAYDSIHHNLPANIPPPLQPTQPTPQPRSRVPQNPNAFPELPDLPSVPSDLPLPSVPHSNTSLDKPDNASAPDEIDFEDLNRRFEELKKKK